MADDKTEFWIWGVIIASVTGMYGFFVRHIIGHVVLEDFKTLKQNVQYKDNCNEIVKRIDEKLDLIIKKIDKNNQS